MLTGPSHSISMEIVKALSMKNVGDAPPDSQFSMAHGVMEELKSNSVVATFSVNIKQNSSDSPRVMTVHWSSLLQFPSQRFSVLVSDLTKVNYEVMEVMEA